jgi:hypothetical protein
MKKFILIVLLVLLGILTGCSKADNASRNLSVAADNFEVNRRVHFYNGIIGEDFLVIEGYCSLGNYDEVDSLSVTCKVGPNSFKKFYLGLSDNVTYWTEDMDSSAVNVYNYRVIIRPSAIIPGLELDIP